MISQLKGMIYCLWCTVPFYRIYSAIKLYMNYTNILKSARYFKWTEGLSGPSQIMHIQKGKSIIFSRFFLITLKAGADTGFN